MPSSQVLAYRGSRVDAAAGLSLAKSKVMCSKLDLLVRVRLPFDVSLKPVRIARLDDGDPREVLQDDLAHLRVGPAPEAFIETEAGRVAELFESRLPPVFIDGARGEQTPHHAVWIAKSRRRLDPEQALQASVSDLLGADTCLD